MIQIHKKNSIPSVYTDKNSKLARLINYQYSSEKPISKSLLQVFNVNRIKKLSSEVIILNMYINRLGKVISVEYLLKDGTKITPLELEKFEAAVKKNVSFVLTEPDKKAEEPIAPVVQSIHFAKVLDKTFAN